VVLEPHQGRGVEAQRRGVHQHVADVAGTAGLGAQVDEVEAREPGAVYRGVVAAQELVPAAHGQQRGAAVDGRPHRGALGAGEVGRHEVLVLVLPPTHEEDIDAIDVIVAAPDLDHLELDAPAPAAIAQGDDVAAVAIDAHLPRVEVTEAEAAAHRPFQNGSR